MRDSYAPVPQDTLDRNAYDEDLGIWLDRVSPRPDGGSYRPSEIARTRPVYDPFVRRDNLVVTVSWETDKR